MRSLHIAALFVAGLAASGAPALKVLRVAPTDDADPTSVVRVTFDRPVAGSLDRSVDPQVHFHDRAGRQRQSRRITVPPDYRIPDYRIPDYRIIERDTHRHVGCAPRRRGSLGLWARTVNLTRSTSR